ncbi:hypothetical protein AD23_2803 [Escherichia coli 2-005-03_S4_C3]|nr:hypothetical protein AD23_2803 [Escherichia coli 2-005-03_S4_C3]KDT26811.1 hypothetical protein AC67_2820 [Escherichia coli 2-052-05_S4_C1]
MYPSFPSFVFMLSKTSQADWRKLSATNVVGSSSIVSRLQRDF